MKLFNIVIILCFIFAVSCSSNSIESITGYWKYDDTTIGGDKITNAFQLTKNKFIEEGREQDISIKKINDNTFHVIDSQNNNIMFSLTVISKDEMILDAFGKAELHRTTKEEFLSIQQAEIERSPWRHSKTDYDLEPIPDGTPTAF